VLKINIYYQISLDTRVSRSCIIPKVNANKEIIGLTGKHYWKVFVGLYDVCCNYRESKTFASSPWQNGKLRPENSQTNGIIARRNMILRAQHQKGNADSFLISAYFPTASFCRAASFFRFLIKNAERATGGDGLHRRARAG